MAKAIADKIDCGMVTAKVNQQELITLDKIIKERGIRPNQVSDIYKMRRGRYNDVRIWSEMDLGTCRIKDLFITDVDFKPIEDFFPITIAYDEWEEDITSLLTTLNVETSEIIEEPIVETVAPIINLEDVKRSNPDNWVF